MIELPLLAFALIILLFGVISERIDRLLVTAPIFFIGAGIIFASTNAFPPEMGLNKDAIILVAEIALVLILFTDASRLSLPRFRKLYKSPRRSRSPSYRMQGQTASETTDNNRIQLASGGNSHNG